MAYKHFQSVSSSNFSYLSTDGLKFVTGDCAPTVIVVERLPLFSIRTSIVCLRRSQSLSDLRLTSPINFAISNLAPGSKGPTGHFLEGTLVNLTSFVDKIMCVVQD